MAFAQIVSLLKLCFDFKLKNIAELEVDALFIIREFLLFYKLIFFFSIYACFFIKRGEEKGIEKSKSDHPHLRFK